MTSKLTLSLAIALALTAAGGSARANPMPTSTDEARTLAGQDTSKLSIDHTAQANAQVTSTDDARALAGDQTAPPISRSMEALIAGDNGEGRAAVFAGDQETAGQQSVAVAPAGSGTAEQGN